MINSETKRKLRELNLSELITALELQQNEPASVSLPFDERIQRLIDYLYQEKYNNRIQRLIKGAKLRFPQADVQHFQPDGRGLNMQLITELFSCQYISLHQSIILQGPTGSGKTYLSCVFGKQACLQQFKTKYIRFPDLLMEYGDAVLIQGQQKKVIRKYATISLLIIDEWLMSEISDGELHFLFELMERRSDATSTIFCTQYRRNDWIMRLGEGLQAEAITDRYAHSAFWLETGATNMRERCADLQIN
ncbi:MAG: ATP-binding protein [Clostridium sp.]